LATLRDSKHGLRQFTGVPRAKLPTTLLDRIGHQRPLEGVVCENLTYDSVSIQTGEFSFSLHNKLRENVDAIYGLVVFHDRGGNPIDVHPINYGRY